MNRQPNVILIVLDTTRADAIYPLKTNRFMPFLSKFSDECVVFENAISPASWTIPAHAAIFTGMYPSRNGVVERVNGEIPNYSELLEKYEGKTIAETLSEKGYKTVGFSQNLLVAPDTSFARGFAEFYYTNNPHQDTYFRMLRNYNNLIKDFGTTFNEIVPKILGINEVIKFTSLYMKVKRDTWWLRKADLSDKGGIKVIDRIRNFDLKEPFFLFMNLMEMHDPHDNISLKLNWSDSFFRNEKLSEDKVKIIRNSYFRAANKVDLILSELISILKKKELLDNSLLIITSDHGQSLMEKNDFFGHGTFLYDELVKVPLIIRLPFGKKIKIENGYQSTTQIKSFIDNTVNGINTFDSISTDFAFSESYGSLDNELSKHKNEKKYTEVLASVDVPRKAIYCNGFKLSLELKNNKIEEFTKNSLPVNFNDYRDIFDNLKEKIEIFG